MNIKALLHRYMENLWNVQKKTHIGLLILCSKYQHLNALKQVTYPLCNICIQCNSQSDRMFVSCICSIFQTCWQPVWQWHKSWNGWVNCCILCFGELCPDFTRFDPCPCKNNSRVVDWSVSMYSKLAPVSSIFLILDTLFYWP